MGRKITIFCLLLLLCGCAKVEQTVPTAASTAVVTEAPMTVPEEASSEAAALAEAPPPAVSVVLAAEPSGQREVTIDTQDYLSALRAGVRQAPDVILLGEMRDAETMHTAMSAAETGHMVIATLHTKGAVNAIDRIIDLFPSTQQPQIRVQLATVLKTVVSQQLLPDMEGGMIPACEIMHMNSAIRSMIRDNKNHQIDNAITSGGKEGMISMDQAIARHYREGRITKETALLYADHPDQLKRNMNG